MEITIKNYFQEPSKVITTENWSTFAGHPKLPKILLFQWKPQKISFIFDSKIPLKIGHNRRK
jgi:hypothetical protein